MQEILGTGALSPGLRRVQRIQRRVGAASAANGYAALDLASLSQVSTTVSGLSDTDSMPWSMSH